MVNQQQAALLTEFGNNIGLELAFNDAGICLLMVDEALISLRAIDEHCVFHATLGEFPQALPGGFWKQLLSLNAMLVEERHGAIGIDLETDAVSLMHRVDVIANGMTAVQLAESLRVFVDQVNHLVILLKKELAVFDGVGFDNGDPDAPPENGMFPHMA